MNIALLTAAGIGNRMGGEIPKQFLLIDSVPAIIYTLNAFQCHIEIDAIAVVCLTGWEEKLKNYAKKYNISKLKWIFTGGNTNQDSIFNGISGLKKEGCKDSDIILVHDGVRPLIDERIISDNIRTCKQFGFAVTGLVCKEIVMEKGCDVLIPISLSRERLVLTQTPHTSHLGELIRSHQIAKENGITGTVAPCDMYAKIGAENPHWVQGSEKNSLKLTRIEDIDIFKALIAIEKQKSK